MSEDMVKKQQNVVSSTAKDVLRTRKQPAEERCVQDALEDDEVREALKVLRARGKNKSDSNKSD
jgi:hypothetical protein